LSSDFVLEADDLSDTFRDALAAALGGNYTIERELTGGGMSRVFVATEHALGRTVVVKVLREEFAADVNRERFKREVTLAAQLSHPHIVQLLTAGQAGDLLWYTMPFVEGESVRDEIRRGRHFSVRDLVRLLHDVLDALAYAHSRGVIHRDIKPGNILRHGNHSLVTDFGVAKALSAARPTSGTTSTGMAIGTPAYMAPEQLAADPAADHRVDLYAVGLVAYEVLTHVQPFAASSPQETMAAQLTRMPEPISRVRPDIPNGLSSLIMKLLAKNPADRPATAMAAIDELDSMTTPVEVPSGARAAVRGSSKRRAMIAAGVVLLAAAILIPLAANSKKTVVGVTVFPDSVKSPAKQAPVATLPAGRASASAGASVTTAASPAAKAPSDSTRGAKTKTTTKAATKTAPARTAPPRFATPRRVAVLPIRISGTTRDDLSAATRAIQDSLRRALAAAGYTIATDAQLVDLLAQPALPLQRRIALEQQTGAVVAMDLVARGDELLLQSQVMDSWRSQILPDREVADRDKPRDLMDIIRSVTRTLDRISWRTVGEPRQVLVFDFDNMTGIDSLNSVTAGMADHVRALVVKDGMRVVGDSAARGTKDVLERRQTAIRLGAGASIAGTLLRTRGDTIVLRVSMRDHSEEVTHPNIEARVHRTQLLEALPALLGRVRDMLAAVNWGPKKGPM
jgi:serine/threonine-protein kinase